jgi:hypothetical protein
MRYPPVNSFVRDITAPLPWWRWNPVHASPILLLDPRHGVLRTGGDAAGYLDPVPTWKNQGVGASDATQGTSNNQPVYLYHDGENYLHLPGIAQNLASVSDSEDLRVTGDVDIRAKVKIATLGNYYLVAKWATSTNQRAYSLQVTSGGLIRIGFSSDGGSGFATRDSTSTIPLNQKVWLRVTRQASTGDIAFFLSGDGVNWESAGTETSSPASLFNGTAPLNVSGHSNNTSTLNLLGAVYRAEVYASVDGTDRRLAVDFSKVSHGATSFVCDTGHTVSILANGNNRATVVGHPMLRFDGADDRMAGTFPTALLGGRMFLVCNSISNGDTPRIFSSAPESLDDSNSAGVTWAFRNGSTQLAIRYQGILQSSHTGGYLGRFINEALVSPDGGLSRRNGVELVYSTKATSTNVTRWAISGSAAQENVSFSANIDLEYLAIFPASMPAADVARMRSYLSARFGLAA